MTRHGRNLSNLRRTFVWLIVAAIASIGLTGCGKVPTWNEMTGGQTPAPPAQPTPVPNTVIPAGQQPAAAPVMPQQDPAQVLAWFKALQPMQIGDESLIRLTSIQSGLGEIKQINASGGTISDKGMAELAKLPNLEKLMLDGNPISNEGLKSLQRIPALQSLTLNSTRISADGLGHLVALPNLKALELMGTNLTPADFEAIGKLPGLERLVLNRVLELNDPGLDAVCNATTLKSLHLVECVGLTDKGLVALAKAPGLEELYLNRANITGVGLGAAASRGGLKNLKVLMLSAAPISLPGARAINSLKTLEKLDIGFVPGMNDNFFVEFVEGLKNLKHLNIEACKGILGAGFSKMKACSNTLETISAQNTSVTDQSLGFLKGHKVLKFMDLTNTNASTVGVQQFKKLIPACEILYAGNRY